MLFRFDEVSQRRTNEVVGNYGADEALRMLLTNTDLKASFSDMGNLIIKIEANLRDAPMKQNKNPTQIEKRPSFLHRAVAAVGMIATALVSPTVNAEELARESHNQIEEIVVTAQKREGLLEKTPVAITAVTAEMIEKLDIADIDRLSQVAPSLTYNRAYAGVQLFIRGVGQDAPTIGSSPGVAVYVDDVYHGHQFANAATAFDVARYEVLRGPQGTLYGRNSTGGNINIHSKEPHFDQELDLEAVAGSDALKRFAVTANLALKEDLIAVRGTLFTHTRDGYRTNLANGEDVDTMDTRAAKIAVLVTPAPDLELLFRADYQSDDGGPRPTAYLERVAGSGLSPLAFGGRAVGFTDANVYSDTAETETTEFRGLSARVSWLVNGITFKSVTSYRESEKSGLADADGTDASFATNQNVTRTEELSQEFNLIGAAMEDKLEWILGVNYYDDDAYNRANFGLPVYALLLPSVPAVPTLDGTVSSTPFLDGDRTEQVSSIGVFAQGSYSVTPATRITLGYRYTREDKDARTSAISNITPPAAHCTDEINSNRWSPSTFRIGVDHDFDHGGMGYATFSRGFKAGGFNLASCGGLPFDEEFLDAFEVGYKGRFYDGRLRLASSAFYYDYTDMQVRQFTPNLSVQFQNAAEAEIYGLELEAVLRTSENWRIDAGVNWQNAEYKKGSLDDTMIPGILETDISGNKLLRAPDLKANLGIQYTTWLGERGSIEARFDASFSDEFFVDAHQNPFARVDARTVHNLRLTWTNATRNAWVQLFANNVTDEEYLEWLLMAPTNGGTVGAWAAPRTYGIRVGYGTP